MPRRHNAPDGPGPDDASPLDFCGWCFDWIPREAEHFSHAVDRSIADPGESPFFEGRIDDHLVFGILPEPGCNPEFAGAGAVVVLCSNDCRTDLLMAVARQQARARGELVPPRLPTPAAREGAADILKDYCAWCRAPIADKAPVEHDLQPTRRFLALVAGIEAEAPR